MLKQGLSPFLKNFIFLAVTFVILLCPAAGFLGMNGLPLDQKGEWLFAMGLFVLFMGSLLPFFLPHPRVSKKKSASELWFWGLALTILLLKLFKPALPHYELCARSPLDQKEQKTCFTFNEVSFGGKRQWVLGFFNTLEFNLYHCELADLLCQNKMRLRHDKMEPFEVEVSASQPIGGEVRFTGEIEGLKDFSREQRSVAISSTRFLYRNYQCKDKACFNQSGYEVLPLLQSTLVIPNSISFFEREGLTFLFLALFVLILWQWLNAFVLPLKGNEEKLSLLFLAVGFFMLLRVKLPLWDEMQLFEPGNDWLTYASWANEIWNRKNFSRFTDIHLVLSKPFFLYYRTFLMGLFGEGTLFLQKATEVMLGSFVLLFSLVLVSRFSKRSYLASLLGGISLYFFLDSWIGYAFKFYPGMAEQPAWFLGALSALAFLSGFDFREKKKKTLCYGLGLVFLCASVSMRINQAFDLFLLPLFCLLFDPLAAKPLLRRGRIILGIFFLLVLLQAFIGVAHDLNGFLGYLQSNMQAKPVAITTTHNTDVLFSRPFLFALILFAFLVASLGQAKKTITMWSALGFSLFLHKLIKDPAYYPRHHVFLFYLVSILNIWFLFTGHFTSEEST